MLLLFHESKNPIYKHPVYEKNITFARADRSLYRVPLMIARSGKRRKKQS